MVDQLTPGKYQVEAKLCWLSCLYMVIVLVTGVNSSLPPLPTQKQKRSEMQPDRPPPSWSKLHHVAAASILIHQLM